MNAEELDATGKQHKIFYGWWVISACTIIYGFSALINYTYTIYAQFILKELHWTKADFGGVNSAFLFVMMVGGVLSGWFADRFGSRRIIIIGAIITITGMVLFSTMKTITQAYIYYSGFIALGLAFQFLIPTQNLARLWFMKRAGLASGIMLSVYGIIATVSFPLLTELATRFGWRVMILISGIIIEVVIFLVAIFIVRDRPEEMGLNMDGMSDEEAKLILSAAGNRADEPHMTRGQALRTSQFWILTLGVALVGMFFNGFLRHITLIGSSVGMTAKQAGYVMSAYALPSVLGRLFGGWFADKLGKRRVFIIFSIICGLLYFYAGFFAKSAVHLYIFAGLFGIFSSPVLVTMAPFLGDLFGRMHLASIRGFHGLVQGGITFMGPYIAGKMAMSLGGYNEYYMLGGVASIVFTISIFFLKKTHVEQKLMK